MVINSGIGSISIWRPVVILLFEFGYQKPNLDSQPLKAYERPMLVDHRPDYDDEEERPEDRAHKDA